VVSTQSTTPGPKNFFFFFFWRENNIATFATNLELELLRKHGQHYGSNADVLFSIHR
jgi:hypothetical protein